MRSKTVMLALHGTPILLQLVVPLVLLGWQAFSRDPSSCRWLIRTGAVLLYLVAIYVGGLWLVLPRYTAVVLMAALAATVLWQLRGVRRLPWRTNRPSWMAIAAGAAVAATAVVVFVISANARRIPNGPVVDLEFPLGNGTYYVVNGGSEELLNAHVTTLTGERFRTYRGQSYGIDVVKVGSLGVRAVGPLPAEPARYAIYGDIVYAPCAGVVITAKDGLRDMSPPQPDRTHIAGNHVLLDCRGAHVLLGHLQRGSIQVDAGQPVRTTTVVGRVGNSGNSNEPHLHVHAQWPAAAGGQPFSAEPVPIRFNGRFLVRNDHVTSSRSEAAIDVR